MIILFSMVGKWSELFSVENFFLSIYIFLLPYKIFKSMKTGLDKFIDKNNPWQPKMAIYFQPKSIFVRFLQ